MTEKRFKLRFSGFDEDWIEINIKNYSTIKGRIGWRNLKQSEYTESGPYLIAGKHITNGIINWTECDHLSMERYDESPEIALKSGDVIFSKDGSLGNPALIRELPDKATINGTMMLVRLHDKVTPNFFYQVLNSDSFLRLLHVLKSGSSIPHIFQRDMENFKFKIPQSLKEQNQISSFLEVVDEKIGLLKKKYESYVNFKKYLMQQIFAQKLRFANFTEEWKTVKIKDIFDERSEKGFSDLELLSVTLNDGVIKRSEIESKDNSNENKSNYKHVLPDDIVYNSMRMWQGASGVSSYEGIVSPAYTILIPKNAYSKFFGYYFKTNEMIHQFKKYSQGLTSDTWNLKYPLISEIKIKIPSIDEQKEITNVFETIDLKTKILQNNLEEVMTFKKGLLQQMFV